MFHPISFNLDSLVTFLGGWGEKVGFNTVVYNIKMLN